MGMTKLQMGLAGAIVATGTVGFVVQAQNEAALTQELTAVQAQRTALGDWEGERKEQQRVAAEVSELRAAQTNLARLQEDAALVQRQLAEATKRQAALARAKAAPDPAAAPRIFKINELDRQPLPRYQVPPSYPTALRTAGVSGEVVVDFLIDAEGAVRDARAAQSTQEEFEAPALEAVRQWKFDPGRKGDQAVPTRLQVPIVFTLTENE
jgi:TonB family protein